MKISRFTVFRVKNIDQLKNGQPIWTFTDVMLFPNYFYSDKSIVTSIVETGLHIDSIENHFTEERRVVYNHKEPSFPII